MSAASYPFVIWVGLLLFVTVMFSWRGTRPTHDVTYAESKALMYAEALAALEAEFIRDDITAETFDFEVEELLRNSP